MIYHTFHDGCKKCRDFLMIFRKIIAKVKSINLSHHHHPTHLCNINAFITDYQGNRNVKDKLKVCETDKSEENCLRNPTIYRKN